MSQRTSLIHELRHLKARGITSDSPEFMAALHRFDQRRALHPPRDEQTMKRVNARIREDLKEFLPKSFEAHGRMPEISKDETYLIPSSDEQIIPNNEPLSVIPESE